MGGGERERERERENKAKEAWMAFDLFSGIGYYVEVELDSTTGWSLVIIRIVEQSIICLADEEKQILADP
jgi:hypothetical protein